MKTTVKKILLTLFAVMLFAVVLCFNVSALEATGECGAEGDNVTWRFDSSTGTLTISGDGEMKNYNSWDNRSPFYYKLEIKSVVIEEGVTTVGNYVFYACQSLENVKISDTVTSIGNSAFYGCNSLENLSIGNNVTSIGSCAIYNCTSIMELTLPESVTNISGGLFSGYQNVVKITVYNKELDVLKMPSSAVVWCYKNSKTHNSCIENNYCFVLIDGTDEENKPRGTVGKINWILDKTTGVLEISGVGAVPYFGDIGAPWKDFYRNITTVKYSDGITELTTEHSIYPYLKTVIIPNSVTRIERIFNGCRKLESITIPDSITSIGSYAFSYCEKLESITIPDSVTTLGAWSFSYCTSLKSVTIGRGVTLIDDDTFKDCSSLESVIIGSSVTKIRPSAFFNCKSLETLTIPCSVKYISGSALPGTLKEIYIFSPDCELDKECGLNYSNSIYGFKGSTAERFADEIGAVFIDIETVHTHKEVVIHGKEATCTEKGLTEGKRCADCGVEFVKQEEIPLAKHTLTTLKAVKATYTKTGLTEGKKCKVCGKVTVKQKKVAKKKLKKVTVSSVKSTKAKTATVTWKKTTDATGYIVEYSTSKKFTKKTTKTVKIKKGKTTKTTLKKLKSGKKYYVRVKAYRTENKKTVYGSYSSVKTVKIK